MTEQIKVPIEYGLKWAQGTMFYVEVWIPKGRGLGIARLVGSQASTCSMLFARWHQWCNSCCQYRSSLLIFQRLTSRFTIWCKNAQHDDIHDNASSLQQQELHTTDQMTFCNVKNSFSVQRCFLLVFASFLYFSCKHSVNTLLQQTGSQRPHHWHSLANTVENMQLPKETHGTDLW